MYQLVVGVDGSDASLWALTWGLHEATLRCLPLHVARVWHPAGWADEENGRTPATGGPALDHLIDEVRAGHPQWAPPEIVPVSIQGEPTVILAELVDDHDLLVVGAHGKGPLERVALGSVTTWAVRTAPCPVTVIPGPRQVAGTAGVPASWDSSDLPGQGRGVVVGVDGSLPSARALAWGAEHAAVRGLPLSVVHAVGPVEAAAMLEGGTAGPAARQGDVVGQATRQDGVSRGRRLVDEMVEKLLADRCEPLTVPVGTSVVEGAPAAVLTSLSRGAHGIVVGRRGATPHWRVLGDVASPVVHHAVCPVTVIP